MWSEKPDSTYDKHLSPCSTYHLNFSVVYIMEDETGQSKERASAIGLSKRAFSAKAVQQNTQLLNKPLW